MAIDKAGHFVNLYTSRLRKPQTDIWGADVWKGSCTVAVFAANKADADSHGLKPNPLSTEARAIADKPPALVQPQGDGAVATTLAAIWKKSPGGQRGAGHSHRLGGRAQELSELRHQAHDGRGRPPWRHDQQGGRRIEVGKFAKGRQQGRLGRARRGRSGGRQSCGEGRRRPSARQGVGVPAHAQHGHEATRQCPRSGTGR